MKLTDLQIKCHVCKGTCYVWTVGGNSAPCRRCREGKIMAFSPRQADVIHAVNPGPVVVKPDGTLFSLVAEQERWVNGDRQTLYRLAPIE